MKTITFVIDPENMEVKIETDGYTGDDCLKDAQPFLDALGQPDGAPIMKVSATATIARISKNVQL